MDVDEARQHVIDSWLTDKCVVRSPGVPTFDEDEGIDVVEPGATVYEDVCRLRPTGGQRVVMVGDAPVTLRTFDLWLRWDATGVMVNQLATITASGDPHVVDRAYRVLDVEGGSETVYRHLTVEDTVTIDEGEDEEEGS